MQAMKIMKDELLPWGNCLIWFDYGAAVERIGKCFHDQLQNIPMSSDTNEVFYGQYSV